MSENTELSEKVQDSEIEVLEGDADADRWTNYGKDRVYLNNNDFSGKYDAYVDLEAGEFVCDYSSDFRMEIEDGVATITKDWTEHRHHEENVEHSEVVVRVRLWETEDEEEEGETEAEDADEDDENETESIVDRLEKDREYNSNRSTVDSEKAREALREYKKKLRNTPNSELSDSEKAAKWSTKASLHLGERVQDTDILREMEEVL